MKENSRGAKPMEKVTQHYYKVKANSIAKKLARRGFQPIICQTLAEAKERALAMIDPEKVVSFGGSVTVNQSGIIEALYNRKQPLIDRDTAKDIADRHQLMKRALTADYFLTSVNGISEDGELVNVDSIGNRVAAITYGPDKVLVFAGMNKVYGDLDTTIQLVRRNTAPLNAHRLDLQKTPCIKKGLCGDCLLEECICNTIAVTRRSWLKDRIVIFLILEDVGF